MGNLQITLLYLMTIVGENASCIGTRIGTQEVGGLDVHFSMANSITKCLPLASLRHLA